MKSPQEKNTRLESLDALRGFDLFCLVALETLLHPLSQVVEVPWFATFMKGFTHIPWEGFSPWDLVMPLFLFMSGVSIPFALSRYRGASDRSAVYRRIGKRVLLLWIFGMMCQGNLLALDPQHIYLYSNTLQAIAAGYLIASLLFLTTRTATRIAVAAGLLFLYWACMQWIRIDGYGGGNYTPEGNLAEWIDRTVLGRFRDGASLTDGKVVFAPGYTYTWILSSLNFGVTVLTGLFAGQLLKSRLPAGRKALWLVSIGIALAGAGWLWNLQMPVVKRIWTSSMVLVSSGYCFLLMAAFYYWIDCRGHRKHLTWLKVYGMNSITAYLLTCVVSFRCIGESLFFGLQPYLGNYYPVLISLSNVSVIYILLWRLYKQGVFLKV